MATYTFFTNPRSRGLIASWALHEVGADFAVVAVGWGDKPPALLAANPLGKVPTLVHHAAEGDRVVTEAAAICTYLAEQHPEAGLLPTPAESGHYHRWLFFAAGPLEQALMARMLGWELPAEREGTAGFGSFDRTVAALDAHLSANAYACGDRFTMADVYLTSQFDWGLNLKLLPRHDAFLAYAERCHARPAYQAALAADRELYRSTRAEA